MNGNTGMEAKIGVTVSVLIGGVAVIMGPNLIVGIILIVLALIWWFFLADYFLELKPKNRKALVKALTEMGTSAYALIQQRHTLLVERAKPRYTIDAFEGEPEHAALEIYAAAKKSVEDERRIAGIRFRDIVGTFISGMDELIDRTSESTDVSTIRQSVDNMFDKTMHDIVDRTKPFRRHRHAAP